MAKSKCTHNVVLNEDKHEYICTKCNKVFPSVTTILAKHGLTADYSSIDSGTLKAKAERGTFIHKELEKYIKTGEMGFTDEVEQFAGWANLITREIESERIVHNEIAAGTLDMMSISDWRLTIADFKTSAKLDKEGVRWQLSLYDYLNDRHKDADELLVFHFTPDGMKIIEMQPIAKAEIERLLECESNGVLYVKNQLVVAEDLALNYEKAELAIKALMDQKKHLDAVADDFRAQMLALMQKQDIKEYNLPHGTKITRVDGYPRVSVDSTALKTDLPDTYNKYTKTTQVAASLRISWPKPKALGEVE